MFVEQCQHARVVLDAAGGAMLFLQGLAQVAEHCRQVPATKDVGVIERCRPVQQGTQIVVRVEDLLVLGIRPRMRGDHLTASHHVDAIHINFDADGLERGRPRHTVAIGVETHHLVLVHFGGLNEARIEARFRQGQGLVTLAREALTDRLGLAGLNPVSVTQATGAQVSVELG